MASQSSLLSVVRLATFALAIATAGAVPTPLLGSREYKIILDETKFTGAVGSSTVLTKVRNYWDALAPLLTCCSQTSGSSAFDLRKSRTVRFFDVPSSQGSSLSCWLNKNSYSYRERVDDASGAREVTLKARSADRYIASNENVDGSSSGWTTKFEEDVSPTFISKFSRSTTVGIGSGKNLNEMDDINSEFAGFNSQYALSNSIPLSIVSGLNIVERVYEDREILVGSSSATAAFSVTIWYSSSAATTPILVESSFKYEKADEDYGRTTVRNAKAVFDAMQSLTSWNSADSSTKTNLVYTYSPGWCI